MQNNTFTQSNSVRAVLDFLVLFSAFVRKKVDINENISFTGYASGIRLPDCSKLAKIGKMALASSPNFFDVVLFSCQVKLLVRVSCHYRPGSYDNFFL